MAASGALVAQNQGAADVNMGVGTIIAGLASVIIGETVFGNRTITRAIIAALLGSILYRIAIALALGPQARQLFHHPERPQPDHRSAGGGRPGHAADQEQSETRAGRREDEMISMTGITKAFHKGDVNEVVALRDVTLHINDGDFITHHRLQRRRQIDLLNAVAGSFPLDAGTIRLGDDDVTGWPEYRRASLIGRVFQDPLLGTCSGGDH